MKVSDRRARELLVTYQPQSYEDAAKHLRKCKDTLRRKIQDTLADKILLDDPEYADRMRARNLGEAHVDIAVFALGRVRLRMGSDFKITLEGDPRDLRALTGRCK